MKIMLVDDERSLCEVIGLMVRRAGYDFVSAHDGVGALELFQCELPDLVILDVMLPGMNGFELCEAIRNYSQTVPILMLSAKCDIVDKRVGFKSGADDYLGKPFEQEELLLRIEALLRRRMSNTKEGIAETIPKGCINPVEDLVIDLERFEVIVRGQPVSLTAKEFQIVKLLAGHPGKVFTREDIIRGVWGEDYQANSISIPTFVRHIREKIELDPSDPQLLQTVFGFGYRLGK